jgi:hypothetical protein
MPTPRRPLHTFAPNQRIALNTRVRPSIRQWMEERADANGRTLMADHEHVLEEFHGLENDFGGRQEFDFLRSTAMAIVTRCGAGWLAHPAGILEAADVAQVCFQTLETKFDDVAWMLAFTARALEGFQRTGKPTFIKAARSLIDFAYMVGDTLPKLVPVRDRMRDLVSGYEEIIADFEQETGKPFAPEVVALAGERVAATNAEPTTSPPRISFAEMIGAGRRVIDQLAAARDPTRRAHLQQTLGALALIPGIDEATRAEFAKAATNPPEPLPAASTAPAPEETRAAEVSLFEAAWNIAEKLTHGAAPTPEEIGETFAQDDKLIFIAKLPPTATAETILAFRDMIARVKAEAVVPPARVNKEELVAAADVPAPRPTRRRRRSL